MSERIPDDKLTHKYGLRMAQVLEDSDALRAEVEALNRDQNIALVREASLRAEIERLKEVLLALADEHDEDYHGSPPCGCPAHERARAALEPKP